MKVIACLTSAALFIGAACPARARIGDTMEQCVARYGEPTKRAANGMCFFEKSGFVVGARFFNEHVDSMYFVKKEADELGRHPAISDNEIDLLLKANGGGRPWQKLDVVSVDRTWRTDDLSVVATYATLEPALTILTKEAVARQIEATKREEQKKLEGF